MSSRGLFASSRSPSQKAFEAGLPNPFYELEAKDIKHQPFHFKDLKGKVVLIVNVASQCGFTPQYAGLQALYTKYKDQGLVILGFPCMQFAGQEYEEETRTFPASPWSPLRPRRPGLTPGPGLAAPSLTQRLRRSARATTT